MGTTLAHGVYLPDEGERNCYAGLKLNWETLDQKVADISALQSAIAGALHREIVVSLPTTDIDTATIYMILNGTSATENIYDEYMYISNAWELIGTSATDLTNYYTKAEVDGKLLLKANASDLTSHTGDTTIHVTASDKAKWNTVALIKQLRLVNTQVDSATTIPFSDFDDTNGIKVGDKCMDLDAKLFEITAVDTTNETVTVGSALIDLALDANVVHTSGNETVGGQKTFSDTATFGSVNVDDIRWKSLVNQTVDLNDCYIAKAGAISGYYTTDINSGANISNKATNTAFIMISLTTRRVSASDYQVRQVFYGSGAKYIRTCSNGTWTTWVNETDKYVTIDTAQTISGAKTFADNLTIYNSNDTQTPKGLVIRNAQWGMGESGGTTVSNINFLDKNSSIPASVMASKGLYGQSFLRFNVRTKDSQNTTYSEEIYYDIDTSGNVEFRSWHDNVISLGTSAYKWKDVQTYLVNGLTPSSLGMPTDNLSNIIDISGYLTILDGSSANTYQAPSNGYISITMNNCLGVQAYITGFWGHQVVRPSIGSVRFLMPICKNMTANILIFSGTIDNARFIPCQGNI